MADLQAEEPVKLCKNCKKEIRTSVYELHAVHCHRHITLCPRCNETFPKTDLEKHLAEDHKDVACEWCKQMFDATLTDKHQAECQKRPVLCSFCELAVATDELANHEKACGSRTELCDKCGTYVKLADMKQHTGVECKRCADEKLQKEQQANERRQMDLGGYGFQNNVGPRLGIPRYDNRWDAGGPRSAFGMMNLAARPGPSKEPVARKVEIAAASNEAEAKADVDQSDAILCEFCNELFPVKVYVKHAKKCESKHGNRRYTERGKRGDTQDNPIKLDVDDDRAADADDVEILEDPIGAAVGPLHTAKAPNRDEIMVDMIPCQFCKTLQPEYEIFNHQKRCDKRDDDLIGLGGYPVGHTHLPDEEQYERMEVPHGRRDYKIDNDDDDEEDVLAAAAVAAAFGQPDTIPKPSEEENMIPCEFCLKPQPIEHLEAHQEACMTSQQQLRRHGRSHNATKKNQSILIDDDDEDEDRWGRNEHARGRTRAISPDREDDDIAKMAVHQAEDCVPCECCGKPIAFGYFGEHQAYCLYKNDPSDDYGRSNSKSADDEHDSELGVMKSPQAASRFDQTRSAYEASERAKADADLTRSTAHNAPDSYACVYCKKSCKVEELIHHEKFCGEAPSQKARRREQARQLSGYTDNVGGDNSLATYHPRRDATSSQEAVRYDWQDHRDVNNSKRYTSSTTSQSFGPSAPDYRSNSSSTSLGTSSTSYAFSSVAQRQCDAAVGHNERMQKARSTNSSNAWTGSRNTFEPVHIPKPLANRTSYEKTQTGGYRSSLSIDTHASHSSPTTSTGRNAYPYQNTDRPSRDSHY